MKKALFQQIASLIGAIQNCRKTGNAEWEDKHSEKLANLVNNWMPSGGGFDSGTHLNLDASGTEKIVFNTQYHHMNEVGMYDGWTRHDVTVTPSFVGGFSLAISGPNRKDIKEYIHDAFWNALTNEIEI